MVTVLTAVRTTERCNVRGAAVGLALKVAWTAGWCKIRGGSEDYQEVNQALVGRHGVVGVLRLLRVVVRWRVQSSFVHPFTQRPAEQTLEFLRDLGFSLGRAPGTIRKTIHVAPLLSTEK